jgi:LacI family transcriptional regulator
VDRVLHSRGRVSKETEERVRRIIEEIDYRPNVFAKHLRLSKIFTFGILMPKPSQDSHYWMLPIQGITRAQRELATQKVRVRYFFYDKYSAGSFNKISAELLQTPLDGILMAPVLSKTFESFIKDIPDDLPFVFFDSFISNARPLAYIGQDSFQSGVLSARLMQMLIPAKGGIAAFRVLPEDYHIDERLNGFVSYCRQQSGMEIHVFEIDGNRSGETRRRTFDKAFDEIPDLRGVFVTNATTNQVAAYIKSRGLQGKVHIIGYYLIEENVRLMREGVIDFLISQQSERQGYEGIYALYRHVVLKMPVESKIMMQLDIVTRENVDYYKS